MKRIDNPRRNINIPDVADWLLEGIGGLHRVGDAVLAVDPGPPQPDDGPLPTDRSASPPIPAILIATPDVPIELGAVQQLAALGRLNTLPAAQAEAFRRQGLSEAAEDHECIGVQTLVGTPDLHRGDAGIAIGTVVGVRDGVMPLGPGPDIGCGMRVLTTDLRVGDLDLRRLGRDLRDDLFLGTRNIPLTRSQRLGLLQEGLAGLLDSEDTADVPASGDGSIWAYYDPDELEWELDHTALSGSLPGDPSLFLDDYVPTIRDPITGTLGRGNHFLEIQEVAEVLDRAVAYAWNIREGMIVATIHTGSRGLGRAVGAYWRDLARAEHPHRLPRPARDTYLLPIGPDDGTPLSGNRYLRAHGAAMNFAFANRFFLGLVVRKRLRAQHREAGVRLLYDMPHNFVAPEWFGGERLFVHRKGAAPALGPSSLVGTPYA